MSVGQPDAPGLDTRAGWQVVWAVHALTAITYGAAYSFSATFPGLAEEFHASRSAVALVFSLAAGGFHLFGFVAGRLADRVSTRAMCVAGVLVMAAGYLAASRAPTLGALYACYGLGVGLGIGLLYVPSMAAVQTWFAVKRSAAAGIATAGLGIGTVVAPMAVGAALPALGWRTCFVILGAAIAVAGLPAALLVRRHPGAVPAAMTSTSRPLLPVLRTAVFARFYLSVLLASICTFIPYVHLVPAARDQGYSLQMGTLLIALIGVGNILGRFALGGIADRIGRLPVLAALTAILGFSFLGWAANSALPVLVGFAVLFGLAYGGCVSLYPAVTADLFGDNGIGATLGALYTSVGLAALVGPTLAGYLRDSTHSYTVPALICAAAALIAAALTYTLHRGTGAQRHQIESPSGFAEPARRRDS
ncbi:OFA family oxalate/formate antiporter-like MFS transporter [Mycobacterium frederiksbergense]|uniref:OFA family oxalate/formate antiporter-like MFS transporter n=1 Tax=Mycolicibacterium frederiksbergense TaxID=117567 RepID=A0ABT6L7W2_9MYCO|nr:MFS transporter [Mycolicibacterium frederiksbergense]MDH6199041.1 OFA family oxalate/formate antiporter-like MFS transporter [Mycolicibacterium frederiksbergense]